MTVEVWGLIGAGIAALLAGLFLVRARFVAAAGIERILLLGPVGEAAALAIFAAEHFLLAGALKTIVPHWLPGALFWTYFVGAALLAAALSLIVWRCVRWSALLLALLFLILVATIHLPNLTAHMHERLFWTLAARELSFAGGAMVLAGSVSPGGQVKGALIILGRSVVACVFVFYAVEHYLFPRFVPGVPLDKMTPVWVPAPVLLAYLVGATLLFAGLGLMNDRTRRAAAAGAGSVLLLLTMFFYVPILIMEIHSPLAIEGINYVGDTLLFAATALLAGFPVSRTVGSDGAGLRIN